MLESMDQIVIPDTLKKYIAHTVFCSDFFANGLSAFNQQSFDLFLHKMQMATVIKSLDIHQIEQLDLENINEDQLKSTLRKWRNTNQMFIIFMDSNQLWSLDQVLQATSKMADIAINSANQYFHNHLKKKFGKPSSSSQNIKNVMSVLAMGKLGAHELNLSSDIDLIFVYPFAGSTIVEDQAVQTSISNQEFFLKVARKIIDCLHQITVDGFVYRVDMRLRPWGDGGQLVLNQNAFFKYYIEHGRDWERFAMVKMRPVCGDELFNRRIIENIQQFVYRSYVDFQALEALRNLKQLINKETLKIPRLNVKLGRGGIREIEFIVQSFQLVRGGSITELQNSNLLEVLTLLSKYKQLPDDAINELKTAYIWFRNIEHGIQAYQDKQGQVLPDDEKLRLKIAKYVGLKFEGQLLNTLKQQMNIVSVHFENCIQKEKTPHNTDKKIDVYLSCLNQGQFQQIDKIDGLAQSCQSLVFEFLSQTQVKKVTPKVQQRLLVTLNFFLQGLLALTEEKQTSTLIVLLKIIESVLRRSSYLSLLNEHPFAIFEMIKLVSLSKWIGNQLIEKPFLFDELTDQSRLYHLPSENELNAQLRLMMLRIEQGDLEQQMETLRLFKHARVFRAAACEIKQTLDLPKVSDYLSQVANVIVQYSLQLAKDQLIERFGLPQDIEDQISDLSVLAYGKMGGYELNYHSDLDVVFIYNSSISGKTDGIKPVENIVFYTKVVQRFMFLLNSNTYNGKLYDVDMRLRPSGNSGSLVCSLAGFERYQLKQAWTWEHQALIRTRCVTGMSPSEYLKLKTSILIACNKENLQQNVSNMRHKMMTQLGTNSALKDQRFDIKHDRGGLVDIEFLVQYWVLQHCEKYPKLCEFSDNLSLLNLLASFKLIDQKVCDQLIDAYVSLRALLHAQVLQDKNSITNGLKSGKKIIATVKSVEVYWQQFMLS